MKQYGFNKATEFTRKQVGVIFARAKAGDLKVEKWFMSELYTLADYYGYDDGRSVERCERQVLSILESVFAGNLKKAQELIDSAENGWYNLFSFKNQAKCDRTAFV